MRDQSQYNAPEHQSTNHSNAGEHVQKQHEPIAVIGIGCRLPGDASSPSKLWDALAAGRSGHCDVPRSRYNAAAFYQADASKPGSINSSTGYFIQEEIRNFDNAFFGINNLEALTMDAQQRKLLEIVYESLESAGQSLESIAGKNIGCYVGNFALDHIVMQLHDPEYVSRYTALGATPNILANRISHAFNLTGPSFVLDTACSSSLYSLHYACCALDLGECESAIVASANLIQSPQHQMIATKAGILSNSGSCRTFDESADGYGRAEGVGALVLKKLSHALRDGDPVRAVIRGTAVNSNGKTNGIMLPDAVGQSEVMNKAYRRAGLQPDQTDYVEAHGTGTAVGDPIEVEAIAKTFSHRTGRPTMIGSVKTNLGHSEAASGISSVIKVILALEHGMIPPTIGIKKINPKVSCRDNVTVVQTLAPWPESDCPRASINSFGFGGANSHAVIESAGPAAWNARMASVPRKRKRLVLLPISAASTASLSRRFEDLKGLLGQSDSDLPLGCTAYTLSERLTHFTKRGYMIVDEAAHANMHLVRKEVRPQILQLQGETPVAFLFTGQGAQWQGMGVELYQHFEVFRKSIDHLGACLDSDSSCPGNLVSLLLAEKGSKSANINDPWVAQVLTTAVQMAIVDLLRHFGIVPSVVVGHSSGEIAAAYASNLLSKREAILCSNARGRAVSMNTAKLPVGAMLAVSLAKEAASELISRLKLDTQVCIACVNSSVNVTLSGDAAAIEILRKTLNSESIFNRELKTGGVAYHSTHMRDFVGSEYHQLLESVLGDEQATLSGQEQVCMISTVKNTVLDAKEAGSAQYWQDNLENTVQFDAAVRTLLQRGPHHVIEVGPHCALKTLFSDICQSTGPEAANNSSSYESVLIRNTDAQESMLQLIGNLYARGLDFQLERVNRIEASERHVETRLPSYPWDYSRGMLWKEPRAIAELRSRRYPRHELLGSIVTGGNGSTLLWRNVFSLNDAPWVQDHRFGPTILFPAAGFLSMAIEAICQACGMRPSTCDALTLRDVRFFKALPLDSSPVEIFTELKRLQISAVESSSQWWQFSIGSFHQESFTAHMGGLIKVNEDHPKKSLASLSLSQGAFEERDPRAWFKRLKSIGLDLGPAFMTFERIWVDRSRMLPEAMAQVKFSRGAVEQGTNNHEYFVHPTTLDGLFQSAFIAAAAGEVRRADPWIPVAIEEIQIAAPSSIDMCTAGPWRTLAKAKVTGFGTVVGNSDLRNSCDETLMTIRNARAITYQGIDNHDDLVDQARFPMLRVCWKPEITKADDEAGRAIEAHAKFLRSTRTDCDALKSLGNAEVAAFLDLVSHKQPDSRILSIGPDTELEAISTSILYGKSAYRRFSKWDHLLIDSNGEVMSKHSVLGDSEHAESVESCNRPAQYQQYDSIVSNSVRNLKIRLDHISISDAAWDAATYTGSRSMVSLQAWPSSPKFLFVSENHVVEGVGRQIYLITSSSPGRPEGLEQAIADCLVDHGFKVTTIELDNIQDDSLPHDALVVSTIELENEILSELQPEQMSRLKTITNTARRILWIARGQIMQGKSPNSVLMLGAARAIMLEQPSLIIATFDTDDACDVSITAEQIIDRLDLITRKEGVDLEYAQHAQAVCVSRWEPAETLNHQFQIKQTARSEILATQQLSNFQIAIERPGQLDTIRFDETDRRQTLADNQVEVEAKCYGMNAKDVYLLNAKFDTPDVTTSCEMGGIVVRVGAAVKSVTVGDRVAVMSPGKYEKFQIVPIVACLKLLPEESFEGTCTLPVVFASALYALVYKAQLEVGESVLIHSATGGLGLACIQIAKLLGAEIYATVGSELKRRHLIEKCGIPADHIFNSRNASFLQGILQATSGKGVDVVINSLTGELLHASVSALAPFGRFIELGKKDILENGRLEMKSFSRHLSFHAFDLMDIYYSDRKQHHSLWQRPSATSCNQHESVKSLCPCRIRSRQSQFVTVFDPEKTYLMVGCFGGIGRSITRWMVSQGAKSFVFMSRSGLMRSSARVLIDDLEKQGVKSQVLTSDVGNAADVKKAIESAPTPIGGIVQASMAVKAVNWESLSCEQWHDGIQAKVQGTWNIHRCLSTGLGNDLDFFLMVSSVSGTIGSPTEPSYCAANAFMDNFARFRRRSGLRGISLGLGVINDVGYLHEHPEMEAVFSRRGFQGISEDEMLQMIDLAINSDSNADSEPQSSDTLVHSHILTGLELQQAKAQARKNGSATIEVLFRDPRAGILAASYARDVGQSSVSSSQTDSPQLSNIPSEVRQAVQAGNTLSEAVGVLVARKFGEIIMLPQEQLDMDVPVVSFGLDSMLAAEFRGYVFQVFRVDLPFMTLLSNTTTMRKLAESVASKLVYSDEYKACKYTMKIFRALSSSTRAHYGIAETSRRLTTTAAHDAQVIFFDIGQDGHRVFTLRVPSCFTPHLEALDEFTRNP
nr:highly reducing polyketide synthase cla2 [Quercus suber]